MKKIVLNTAMVLALGTASVIATSCSSGGEAKTEQNSDAKKLAYACPMQCEGEKVYAQEGSCAVCEMELEQVEVAENAVLSEPAAAPKSEATEETPQTEEVAPAEEHSHEGHDHSHEGHDHSHEGHTH